IMYRGELRNRFYFKHGNSAWGFVMGFDAGTQITENAAEKRIAELKEQISNLKNQNSCVYIWSSGNLWNVSDSKVQKIKHDNLPAYNMEMAIKVARETFGKDVLFKVIT